MHSLPRWWRGSGEGFPFGPKQLGVVEEIWFESSYDRWLAGRQREEGRQPGPDHRPADQRGRRLSPLVAELRAERELGSLFSVQDEISSSVASALNVALLGEPGSAGRAAIHPEAHNAYLLGKYFDRRLREQRNRQVGAGLAPARAGRPNSSALREWKPADCCGVIS